MVDLNFEHVVFQNENTNPMTVPLMFREKGREEHIGHATVQLVGGVMSIVGLCMVEDALGMLDLGATLLSLTSTTDPSKAELTIRNNRPKPTQVILTDTED